MNFQASERLSRRYGPSTWKKVERTAAEGGRGTREEPINSSFNQVKTMLNYLEGHNGAKSRGLKNGIRVYNRFVGLYFSVFGDDRKCSSAAESAPLCRRLRPRSHGNFLIRHTAILVSRYNYFYLINILYLYLISESYMYFYQPIYLVYITHPIFNFEKEIITRKIIGT